MQAYDQRQFDMHRNPAHARRDLAAESLSLLQAAQPGLTARWPDLLDLQVWGSLIGLFELNNLALATPSPVEDYFLLVSQETAACA